MAENVSIVAIICIQRLRFTVAYFYDRFTIEVSFSGRNVCGQITVRRR